MLKISLKFLNKEKKNTLFYLLFLILSYTTMTFYFNLALNPIYGLSKSLDISTLCLGIALYILILSFYAAKCYLETEIPLLGIFKLCGVSLSGMMSFLCCQISFIILVSFAIGTLLGQILLLLFCQMVLSSWLINFSLNVVFTQLFASVMIIIILMIIMTGYLYRYEVLHLLSYQEYLSHHIKKNRILGFSMPRFLAFFFYLGFGLLIVFGNASTSTIYFLIGVIGSYLFLIKSIKSSLHAFLQKRKAKKRYTHRLSLVQNSQIDSFLTNSVCFVQILTFLHLGCLLLYDSYNASYLSEVILYTMMVIGIFSTVLAICFNLNKILTYHLKEYGLLEDLGYDPSVLLKTVRFELAWTLIIFNFLALYYPVLIGIKTCSIFNFSRQFALMLMIVTILAMLLGYFILSKQAEHHFKKAG